MFNGAACSGIYTISPITMVCHHQSLITARNKGNSGSTKDRKLDNLSFEFQEPDICKRNGDLKKHLLWPEILFGSQQY